MRAQTQERTARREEAQKIVDDWFDVEKRTRLQRANPPQEVLDAYRNTVWGYCGHNLDHYKVYEVDGDTLKRRYALYELDAAKEVAEMHRFLTGKEVVVKSYPGAKRANYRLPALKEKFQVMPPLSNEEFESLKADIVENGVRQPITVDQNGQILDGHHRLRAWRELVNEGHDMAPLNVMELHAKSNQERRDLAWSLNMQRRHLTREQKRELIAARLKETPQWSDRRIAKLLGASPSTVGLVRSGLESTVQLGQSEKRVGADGKQRTNKPKAPPEPKVEKASSRPAQTKKAEPTGVPIEIVTGERELPKLAEPPSASRPKPAPVAKLRTQTTIGDWWHLEGAIHSLAKTELDPEETARAMFEDAQDDPEQRAIYAKNADKANQWLNLFAAAMETLEKDE